MLSPKRLRLISLALGIVSIVAWCIGFFGDVLPGKRTFAFRDSGHYYYRLFAWANKELESGVIPLWNPHENTGSPHVADASSSVFYPGKLLFLVPGLDYTLLFNAYVVLHYFIAAAGVASLARAWRMPSFATAISVVCYVSCGPLISQSCNVVFLVGAAWLPWACLALSQLREKPWIGMIWLAAVLSMMVLGGDPQMAYNVILIGIVMIACDRGRRRVIRTSHPNVALDSYRSAYQARGWSRSIGEHFAQWFDRRLIYLGGAAVVAIALSAIQVIPSAIWSRDSARAYYVQPRSVYEAVAYVSASSGRNSGDVPASNKWYQASQGLVGEPIVGTHHDHIYQFSVPPWTLPELFWPNFGGRIYPLHRRWIDEVGGSERVWYPSIYLGCIPCLLAISVWSLRGQSSRQRVLSWLLILSLLAACGWYGLGWVLREVMWITSGTPPQAIRMGSPTGGVYWMLVTFLPGYAQFRYPAKLLIISALSVSLLAGLAVSRIVDGRGSTTVRRLFRVSTALAGITFFGLLVSWFAQSWLVNSLFDRPADRLFGPFDASGAILDSRLSLAVALITLSLGCGLFVLRSRLEKSQYRAVVETLLVVLIGIDFLVANRWVVATAPKEAWESHSPELLAALTDSESEGTERQKPRLGLTRLYRANLYDWLPASFQENSSYDRMEEIVRWDTATLFPKHHLPVSAMLVESYGSISAADQEVVRQVGREFSKVYCDGITPEIAPEMLGVLATDLVIAPSPIYSEKSGRVNWREISAPDSAWIGRYNPSLPRVWLVDHVVKVRGPRGRTFSELQRVAKETFRNEDEWRDLKDVAVVTSRDAKRLRDLKSDSSGECRVLKYSSQRMQIEVLVTDGSMLLVVNEYYRPGWRAKIKSAGDGLGEQHAPVVRVNQVMRGIVVPKGNHIVELYYDPAGFRWGAGISLTSWIALLLVCGGGIVWMRFQRLRVEHRRLTGSGRRRIRSDS